MSSVTGPESWAPSSPCDQLGSGMVLPSLPSPQHQHPAPTTSPAPPKEGEKNLLPLSNMWEIKFQVQQVEYDRARTGGHRPTLPRCSEVYLKLSLPSYVGAGLSPGGWAGAGGVQRRQQCPVPGCCLGRSSCSSGSGWCMVSPSQRWLSCSSPSHHWETLAGGGTLHGTCPEKAALPSCRVFLQPGSCGSHTVTPSPSRDNAGDQRDSSDRAMWS